MFFKSLDLALINTPIIFYRFYWQFIDLFSKQIVSIMITKGLILEIEASCKSKILIDNLFLSYVQVMVNYLAALLKCTLIVKNM